MIIKEYKLYKTVKKTAKENKLEISERNPNILFDFSAFDAIKQCLISDTEKQIIKEDALNYVCVTDRNSFYGSRFSNFESCEGHAIYLKHLVYDSSGKRLYVIMQLGKINHTHLERECIYSDWKSTAVEYNSGYAEPSNNLVIS